MTSTVIAPSGGAPSQLIAREIRAELARQQLSNRRLALALGVSSMWVNRRISACETELTFEDTQRIADALGVPVAGFLSPWLGNAPSPSGPVIGAYLGESNTQSYDNVRDFPVTSEPLGEESGAMRGTRTAAA